MAWWQKIFFRSLVPKAKQKQHKSAVYCCYLSAKNEKWKSHIGSVRAKEMTGKIGTFGVVTASQFTTYGYIVDRAGNQGGRWRGGFPGVPPRIYV